MSDYEAEYQRERAEGYRNAALAEKRRAEAAEVHNRNYLRYIKGLELRAEAAEAELAAHTSVQCWRTECIVNEGRIAKALALIDQLSGPSPRYLPFTELRAALTGGGSGA